MGTEVVGLAIAGPPDGDARRALLGVGVEPAFRRQGLAGALLATCVEVGQDGHVGHTAAVTLAERDPLEPLDRSVRGRVARRLLESAGFRVSPADPIILGVDPGAISAVRTGVGVAS